MVRWVPITYDDSSSSVVLKLLAEKLRPNHDRRIQAFFVSSAVFSMLQKTLDRYYHINIQDEHSWDYELHIDSFIYEMKLFWILELSAVQFEFICDMSITENLQLDRLINPAFSFLQPKYLEYMDKPFNNPHVYTQVNLILDYHQQQKRRTGTDVFSIFDLIAFKMGIDDNRFAYENCEFHKLIVHALNEMVVNSENSPKKLDLNEYMDKQGTFVIADEIFEYLVYHFQDTIGTIAYKKQPGATHLNVKMSKIRKITHFLKLLDTHDCALVVDESDSTDKSSKWLYEILSNTKRFLLVFIVLDNEWHYDGALRVAQNGVELEKMPGAHISITTQNEFYFIENFINWLKLSFGIRCRDFIVTLDGFQSIRPYILNGLHVNTLQFSHIVINSELVRMLMQCDCIKIEFTDCSLDIDSSERIEFIGHRPNGDRNVIQLLDGMANIESIVLRHEEHTIGTLWKYVTYAMDKGGLTEFRMQNRFSIGSLSLWDVIFCVNTSNSIEMIEVDSERAVEVEEFFFGLADSNRDDFEFYQ